MMLLSILFKATIAMAIGLTTVWAARRSRASVRHAMLAATFGVLLLLPVAAMVERPVRIRLPFAAQPPVVTNGTKIVALPPSQGPAPILAATQTSEPPSISTLLLTLWAAGAALFFAPVLMGLWQVRSLRWSAIRWRETSGVQVLLHESLAGPMTCGVIQPGILLPRDAESWNEADLNRALAHELEHIRRADWLVHCAARVICAVYWFHPLVWMAWRQLTLEAERACDDAVLTGSDATAYADQLVSLARRISESAKAPALAMANRADLSARVSSLLDERRKRGRAGARVVTLACVGAALFAITLAPLTTVASAQDMPKPRMVAESNLVAVDVSVTEPNGRNIEGLLASDFVVTEDDRPQKIALFEYRRAGTYVLGYYASPTRDDNSYRKIHVTLRGDSSARLEYRQGYYTAARRPLATTPPPVRTSSRPGVTPPRLVFKYEPEYTEEARKAKYQGTVLLSALVASDGTVSDIKVLRAIGLGLDEKAKEAVAKWRFKPASQDGQPIDMETEVEVSFRLL
jgi:TonB family protein